MALTTRFFKDGKTKALTMSYDDGPHFDRRLVGIFNEYGIRGTFHLNSGKFDGEDGWNIKSSEVASLYQNHEVSVHTVTHPNLTLCTDMRVVNEIIKDKERLEQLCGYPVRGMSYPFGAYNRHLVEMLPYLGMEYSRTVGATGGFSLPANFLEWHSTSHHNGNILEKGQEFLEKNLPWERNVMYVWGHSFEFDRNDNWDMMEAFCKQMAGHDDVWYATNIEIVDYVNAVRSLKVSVDETLVYNPSAVSVFVGNANEVVEIPAGQTVKL